MSKAVNVLRFNDFEDSDLWVYNFYGSVSLKEEDGAFFWGIQDYNGIQWRECPGYLYEALKKHHQELTERDGQQ